MSKQTKELEMENLPTSSKIEFIQIIKVVKCCRNCKMVYINEIKRTLCPFCGSFYESKEEREKNFNQSFIKSEKILKNRKCLNGNIESEKKEIISQNNNAEYHEIKKSENKGVRYFFKNLVSPKSNLIIKNELIKKKDSDLQNFCTQKKYVMIEDTNLNHRFLTVKNKDIELFSDYRNNIQLITKVDEYR